MKYKLAVLLGAASYGILSTIVTKAYGKGFTLGEVVGSQLLTGCILVWSLVLFRQTRRSVRREGRAITEKPSWQQRLVLMAAGVPNVTTGLLYYESLRYIPNSIAILMLFQFTWMSIVIQVIHQKRRPTGIIWCTLAVLLGGTLLAAGLFGPQPAVFNWRGLLLGFSSAISYSLFILVNGKAVPAVHPTYRSAWMITGGLIFVFVMFPPLFIVNGALLAGLLPFALMLGLFGAFLPPMLYAIGVPHVGEGMTGILGAAELPVAVLLAAAVLHEEVSGLQWIGVIVVLLGVALPELWRRVRQRWTNTSHTSI